MPSDKAHKPKQAPKSSGPVYREIESTRIEAPDAPARMTMDEQKLHELIDSIREVGLIEPIVVRANGDKFQVLAGHRRFIACTALDMPTIPCIIRSVEHISSEAITLHENEHREDLNPAEQAVYFGKLLETVCEGDTDKLAARTHYTRGHVEGRLLLLKGDQGVFDALSRQQITIGVAVELNKVQDVGIRAVYLDAALKSGASVAMVREWRIRANSVYGSDLPVPPDAEIAGAAAMPPPTFTMDCMFCNASTEPWALELVYLHRWCRQAINNALGIGPPDQAPKG